MPDLPIVQTRRFGGEPSQRCAIRALGLCGSAPLVYDGAMTFRRHFCDSGDERLS
jgi:hypothetical protein